MRSFLILCIAALSACAMQPRVGMPLSEWRNQCMDAQWSSGKLVAAEENVEAYICADPAIVYIFEDDTLRKVERVAVRDNTEGLYMSLIGLEMMKQR